MRIRYKTARWPSSLDDEMTPNRGWRESEIWNTVSVNSIGRSWCKVIARAAKLRGSAKKGLSQNKLGRPGWCHIHDPLGTVILIVKVLPRETCQKNLWNGIGKQKSRHWQRVQFSVRMRNRWHGNEAEKHSVHEGNGNVKDHDVGTVDSRWRGRIWGWSRINPEGNTRKRVSAKTEGMSWESSWKNG